MSAGALTERAFESRVEEELVSRGWVQAQGTFSPDYCLDAWEMYRFIGATQIKARERLTELYGDQPTAQRRFAQQVVAEIDNRGALDVLRRGVLGRGVQIDLAFFQLGRLPMGSTHKMIYGPDLQMLRIPLPPLAEQREIVESIRASNSSIDTAVDSIDRQLDLLAERRQALITAAVTGAIDVTTARGLD